ncbi:MAG: tripartite tricarboxylate transporter family receptor [Betaproteobacteria bacterium]|nr:tripartite tricarboxylate transporter family receptor [Betaproteobacteria bacterium]
MHRTEHVMAAILSVLAIAPATDVAAQTYPNKLIRVIVPRAPGGGSDIIGRVLAPGMQKKLGQTFLIENHPDAAAVIGAELTARAAPDGYTVFLADNAFYQNPAIIKKLPYDAVKEFSGVTMLAQSPVILVVGAPVPAKDLKSLIQHAKTNAGKLTYGSGGIGASTHLAGVLFNRAAGVDIVHIPFKSSGQALESLLGNHVTMQFGGISSARAQIDAGRIRAIAVTGRKRDPSVPTVPTFEESGVSGVDVMSIWGIHAPAGTPLAVRRVLRDALVEVMRTPDVNSRLAEAGYDVSGSTPEEHDAETRRLVAFWIDLASRVAISAD